MDDFCRNIAEILEVDEVKPSDVLTDFPEWDSLALLSLIAMIGSQYGVHVTGAQVRNAGTVQAMHEHIVKRRG